MGTRTAAPASTRVPVGRIGRRNLRSALEFDIKLDQPRRANTASAASVVIGAPMTEEAAKGLFLLIMMTGRRRNELNSLTDCLVYAGITAAGFAWLEDILYIAKADSVARSLITAAMRLIMGPFAHPLFTTMTGIGVYFALQQRNITAKIAYILLGYIGAVIMHGLWNDSTLSRPKAYLLVYVLWMVPIFALAIGLGIASRRREQRVVAAKLPAMVAAGLVTPNEATSLGSIRNRRSAIARRLGTGGAPQARRSRTSPPRRWSWPSCATESTVASATSRCSRCRTRRRTGSRRRGQPHRCCSRWPDTARKVPSAPPNPSCGRNRRTPPTAHPAGRRCPSCPAPGLRARRARPAPLRTTVRRAPAAAFATSAPTT